MAQDAQFQVTILGVIFRLVILSPPPGRKLPICYFADVGSTGSHRQVSFAIVRYRLAQALNIKPHRIVWRLLFTTRHTVRLRPGEWELYRLEHRVTGCPGVTKLTEPVPPEVLTAFSDIIHPQPHEHLPV